MDVGGFVGCSCFWSDCSVLYFLSCSNTNITLLVRSLYNRQLSSLDPVEDPEDALDSEEAKLTAAFSKKLRDMCGDQRRFAWSFSF